ncbi:MAG: Zinc-regulated TonB-dependent outer rane receptor [bacterium]|nr:Zinc-regulated TonB-dependent outer rane receptor [bacterium]
MMRLSLAVLMLASAAPAYAQLDGGAPLDGAAAAPVDGGVSQQEIEKAIAADAAAQKKAQAAAAMPVPPPPPITNGGGFGAALGRVFQTLNPDISAIVDFAAGWFQDDLGTIKSGDDPQSTGFKAQEIELALQAVVDPYFRADIFLTIPNLEGIEVEEAYLTTSHLPGNFQLKAGIFRAGIGRQNAQHLHLQDFTRRPAINPQFLGVDGLRAPGLGVNWLVPRIPFYLVLAASAFSVGGAGVDQPLQTFGGGAPWDFTYLATARAFFPLSETISLFAGLNYAHGKTSQRVAGNGTLPSTAEGLTLYDNYYDNLYGADLYLKWKPVNQSRSYASVAWQSEYFVRQIPSLVINGSNHAQVEGGLYSQVVVQFHRRWYLGVRGELMGIPSGDNVKREYAGAGSLTWALSEFSRIRLYGELRYGPRFLPEDIAPHPARVTGAAFLQLEASIGAHGAHPF